MALIISLLGSVNGGSEFSVLVGNPFVETPHGFNYKLAWKRSEVSILVGNPFAETLS